MAFVISLVLLVAGAAISVAGGGDGVAASVLGPLVMGAGVLGLVFALLRLFRPRRWRTLVERPRTRTTPRVADVGARPSGDARNVDERLARHQTSAP